MTYHVGYSITENVPFDPPPRQTAPQPFIPLPGGAVLTGIPLAVALAPNPIGLLVDIYSPASRAITP